MVPDADLGEQHPPSFRARADAGKETSLPELFDSSAVDLPQAKARSHTPHLLLVGLVGKWKEMWLGCDSYSKYGKLCRINGKVNYGEINSVRS